VADSLVINDGGTTLEMQSFTQSLHVYSFNFITYIVCIKLNSQRRIMLCKNV